MGKNDRNSSLILSEATFKRSVLGDTVLNTKLSTIAGVLLFVFFLIENPLESFLPTLSYFDEVLCILVCAVALISFDHGSLGVHTPNFKIIVLTIGVSILGFLGNFSSGFQNDYVVMAKDFLAFIKFPLTCIAVLAVSGKIETSEIISYCATICKVFVLICFFVGILNTISPITDFSHDFRNGIWSFKFIYSHPTFLVFSLVMSFVMMSAKNKSMDIFKILCLVVMLLTMRDKAFGFIGLVLIMWVFDIGNRKNIIPILLIAAALVLAVAWPKISAYLAFSNSPRQSLYMASIAIALSYFPFGGGFATLACPLSIESYSGAYFKYGMSGMEGLTQLQSGAAGDAGLAYYLGEFGIIGFALFAACMFVIFKLFTKSKSLNQTQRYAAYVLFGYLLIALTVEAPLTNATGVMSAFLFAFIAGSRVVPVANGGGRNGR